MEQYLRVTNELMNFINNSPCSFYAVESVKNELIKNGFQELDLCEKWKIRKGGKYFITKNQSACIAFVIGTEEVEKAGFKMIGAHTDSPSFRVKPNPEISSSQYMKLNTEVYGGPILNTWLDRPLSMAGRVTIRSGNPLEPVNKLVDFHRPILIIPNMAIHMNRKINEGIELNKQVDMLPIVGLVNNELEKEKYLLHQIAKELEIDPDDIMDFDLFLYPYEKACIIGVNQEFISAPRLDDLAMVHAGIGALCNSVPKTGINMMICYDNEEIGSRTKQGADSPLLGNILERIMIGMDKNREEYLRALEKSFLISADMAHAVHPNHEEKSDPTNKPLLNKGPVIKISAVQSYTTDSDSDAVYEELCRRAHVPVQKFVNRSDERGGSTIGPITASHLGIRSIDIGNPMLAMHSARELGGVMDQLYIMRTFEEFYKL